LMGVWDSWWGLAQPFLILILEGAPLLSRLLRQGGDFDLHELRMPSQVPHPVPAKNRDKDGAGGWTIQAVFWLEWGSSIAGCILLRSAEQRMNMPGMTTYP
jgi:hypothetical protein